ncbi:MAG: hypothetical protein WCK96_09720 [Methylococcales bacterium]
MKKKLLKTSHIAKSTSELTRSETAFKLPTLEQFMELVTAEQSTSLAGITAYNVYNKYNKTC